MAAKKQIEDDVYPQVAEPAKEAKMFQQEAF